MAKQSTARRQSRSKRKKTDPDTGQDDRQQEDTSYEEELEGEDEQQLEAEDEEQLEAEDEEELEAEDEEELEAEGQEELEGEDEEELEAEADDDYDDAEEEEEEPGLEAELHDLQAELGDDWILRFSVQGDDSWLTAEKDDGSQRVEAPTTAVIADAVELLNQSGGRSALRRVRDDIDELP